MKIDGMFFYPFIWSGFLGVNIGEPKPQLKKAELLRIQPIWI